MKTEATVYMVRDIAVDLGGGISYNDSINMMFVADLEGDEDGFEVVAVHMQISGGVCVTPRSTKPFVTLDRGSPLDLAVRANIAANQDAHDERWQILLEEEGVQAFNSRREYGTHDARAL